MKKYINWINEQLEQSWTIPCCSLLTVCCSAKLLSTRPPSWPSPTHRPTGELFIQSMLLKSSALLAKPNLQFHLQNQVFHFSYLDFDIFVIITLHIKLLNKRHSHNRHSTILNVSDPRYSATYGNPYLRSPPKVSPPLSSRLSSMALSSSSSPPIIDYVLA